MAINKKVLSAIVLSGTAMAGYVFYKGASMFSDTLMKTPVQRSKKPISIEDAIQVHTKNHYGENLRGYYFDYHASKTMLILHPYGLDGPDMLSYVDFFKSRVTCNFLVVDCYAHGSSDGNILHIGKDSERDLLAWIDYIHTYIGGDIVLFGKEMGANIILDASKTLSEDASVKAIISDGAFTRLKDIIGYRLQKDYFILKFPFVRCMQGIIKYRYGVDIEEIDTVKKVRENRIPTLFIHTRKDCFVPLKHVFPLYNATKAKKELIVLKDEEALFLMDRETKDPYLKEVDEVIKDYLL